MVREAAYRAHHRTHGGEAGALTDALLAGTPGRTSLRSPYTAAGAGEAALARRQDYSHVGH